MTTQIVLNIIWMYIKSNPEATIGIMLGIAELITRLTPTKADDGFIMRIGVLVGKVFDLAKIPNKKK